MFRFGVTEIFLHMFSCAVIRSLLKRRLQYLHSFNTSVRSVSRMFSVERQIRLSFKPFPFCLLLLILFTHDFACSAIQSPRTPTLQIGQISVSNDPLSCFAQTFTWKGNDARKNFLLHSGQLTLLPVRIWDINYS